MRPSGPGADATLRIDEAPEVPGAAGRRLGDFELIEVIGRGSYAEVWRARQRGLAREVAVKVLHDRYQALPAVGARFTREADLASRLDHPYAAHVYAVGVEADGTRWFAMELVRGITLERHLELRGRLDTAAFLAMMERLGEVVHAAHSLGLVHRDIKPANILVRSVGGRILPKLMDFGLARLAADGADWVDRRAAPSLPPTATGHGARLGSPSYMSPEQWVDSASAGPAADQYALAVVGFNLLTGELPFVAPDLAALGRLHREAPVPSLGAGFPPALDAVFARAMAKRPGDRWPDVAAFVRALRSAALPAGPDEVPPLDPARRDRALRSLPTPLAEAVARVADAHTAIAGVAAVRLAARVHLRWLGILALALRPALRRAGGPPAADVVLPRLARARLPDQGWAALVREQLAPWAGLADACPLPDLAGLDPGVLDALADLCAIDDDALPEALTGLEVALDALGFLGDTQVVSVTPGGARPWVGVRRRAGAVGEPGVGSAAWVGLHDRDGALVLRLSPLVEVAAPGPGAPLELFLFEGPGRSGSDAVAWPAGYERVLTAIGSEGSLVGHDSSALTASAPEDPRPPWPGLDPWERDDDRRFVGRERELEVVLNRLRDAGLVVIVGTSGSGKSSFLRAGVLRALPDGWQAVVLRPGKAPLAALAPLLGPGGEARLRASPAALGEALQGGGDGVRVLAVDQLEELATLAPPEDAAIFAEALARAAGPGVRVIATLRDDFLVRVGAIGGLSAALSGATFLLETPDRLTLSRILVEPLRQRGYALEEHDLGDRVADELQGRAAALPLLSFAGTRLWLARDVARRVIPAGVYDALGGVAGMVARHAEATWEGLPPTEQAATPALFAALFTSDGTRARRSRADLVALHPGAPGALAAFTTARLLVDDEEAGVEVTHESLLTVWPRLGDWHRARAAHARFREDLAAAARQWDERGRPRGLLWRDEALDELHGWRRRGLGPLPDRDAEFAHACVEADRRAVAAARRVRAGLLLALVAVIVTLGALYRRATEAEADALAQADTTRARLVDLWTDRARQLLTDDPYRALLYLNAAGQAGLDDARLRTLVGAAWAAVPPSTRLAGPAFASVRFEASGAHPLFVSRAGEAWTIGDDGALHPPTFPGDEGRPCGSALHLADRSPGEVSEEVAEGGLARADGTPVGDNFAPRAYVAACLGHDLLIGGRVATWELRDGATGATRWRVDTRDGALTQLIGVRGAPEDPVLVLGYPNGVVEEVAPVRGTRRTIVAPLRFDVRGVLDRDGERAAVWGGGRAGLEVIDLATGRQLWAVPASCGPARAAFIGDGSRALVLDAGCGLREVDAATGAVVRELRPARGQAANITLTDTRALLTSGDSWEVYTLDPVERIAEWRMPAPAAFTVAGGDVWWVGTDGVAHRTGLDSVNVGVPGAPTAPCDAWVGDPTGRRWACLEEWNGGDGVAVWDTPTGAWLGSLRRGPAGLGRSPPAFSADGSRLAFGSDLPHGLLWTPGADPIPLPAPGNPHVRIARISPDGSLVAAAGANDELRLHDGADGRLLRTVPLDSLPFSLAWKPDGARLALGLADGRVEVFDPTTGARTPSEGRHPAYVKALAWEGERLASGSGDGTVIVRDEAGRPTSLRVGFPVLDLQFGPGPFVVATGFGGPVQVWDPEAAVAVMDLGATSSSAWVSPDRSAVRYVRDGQWQVWSAPPWGGTMAELDARVRCEVPLTLDGNRVSARTTVPEGC